jgi:peptidyl-tRNA hydrolase
MTDESTAEAPIGFAPEEIDPNLPTRAARLKWVVVVNSDIPAGRAVNAATCAVAATSRAVTGLLGDEAVDASGIHHPGLPWAGCSILVTDAHTLRTIRDKAANCFGCHVADMPAAAQQTRVYADYLATIKEAPAADIEYYAVSIIGPRKRVDKIVGKLPLMP